MSFLVLWGEIKKSQWNWKSIVRRSIVYPQLYEQYSTPNNFSSKILCWYYLLSWKAIERCEKLNLYWLNTIFMVLITFEKGCHFFEISTWLNVDKIQDLFMMNFPIKCIPKFYFLIHFWWFLKNPSEVLPILVHSNIPSTAQYKPEIPSVT